MSRIFVFEGENNQTLEWIPLDVRRKLDLAGAKLSLAAWQQMSREQRETLVETAVETKADAEAYRALTEKLALACGGTLEMIVPVAFDARPWSTDAALHEIEERARALRIAVDPTRVRALDDAGRYALLRLADPRKSEDKFRAALAELNVAFVKHPRPS
jgi:hypothetical protein